MTAKKSTKTGKNFRGGGIGIFLAGQNIYPCVGVYVTCVFEVELPAGFCTHLNRVERTRETLLEVPRLRAVHEAADVHVYEMLHVLLLQAYRQICHEY